MSSQTTVREILKEFRTTRYPRQFNDAAIYNFLSALDCPRSLTVWLLYSTKEHSQLVDLSVNPNDYVSPLAFRAAYSASEFLSKSDFLDLEVSRKQAAMTKFREFEALCHKTNSRFKDLSFDPLFSGANVWLLNATERKIAQILGDFRADEFVDEAGWGPGVSTTLKGSEVSGFNKFHAERGITRELYAFVSPWFSEAYPSWVKYASGEVIPLESFFSEEVGNRVVTVPKNSKTDRVIAIEPGFNIWFQKAIGSMIRKRLRREGIDLNSQERNQELARLSSIDDSLATIDFSSASDSISTGLVRALFSSSRWITLLESCRSKYGILDSDLYEWKKFSAMGNGFTFELESLIFYAAASAVCDYLKLDSRRISVFGDDVIIPVEAYDLYSSFSEFLGFRLNKKKSFSSTYFRESCGSHYFDGVDCKPIYLKRKISNVESVYKLVNSVRLYAHRCNFHNGCSRSFLHCWRHLYRGLPKALRFGIPLGFGDGGVVMNFDEACPTTSSSSKYSPRPAGRGFEGFRFPLIAFTGVTQSSEHPAMLLNRMWARSTEMSYSNEYTLRGTVRVRLLPNVLTSQWYNIGPWC